MDAALHDRYRIDRELGRGGMATVYLAHDLRHDRPVALKVLDPTLAAAMGPERFLLEIKLTARLQHPHILPRTATCSRPWANRSLHGCITRDSCDGTIGRRAGTCRW